MKVFHRYGETLQRHCLLTLMGTGLLEDGEEGALMKWQKETLSSFYPSVPRVVHRVPTYK